MPTNQYIMPAYGSGVHLLHGWLMEARQEGEAWLQAQAPARNYEAAVELMRGDDRATMSSEMSNTDYPKTKRIARELVASLSNFRHAGEFDVLWDNALYDQAHLLTQLDEHWADMTFANEVHREGLQNAVVKGTNYWVEEWDKHYWGPYKGDIRLTAMPPENVTFVQLPADRDIQRAYMVILKYELPINLAKRMYADTNPGFAHALVPDQESPSWLLKGLAKVQQFLSPALRVAGHTRQNAQGSFPTVNVYHGYILDNSTNEGPTSITMGPLGTNWSYTVPALGDAIPVGITNPATGQSWTRPAAPSDCRLFPLRRLAIWSNTGVCYDGSSPWWHGDAPVTRVWFNDWPWEALGSSLVTDIRTMEQGLVGLMRAMEDSAAARLDPPAIFDDSLVSSSWAKAVNPRLAGVRAAAPLSQGMPIQYPVQPGQYDVPQWIPQFMEAQEARMDYLSGVKDAVALAKAQQIPAADTLEKLMEMAGPIVQDMVRAIEKPLTQLGDWRKAYYLQFYTEKRMIKTVGPDVSTEELAKLSPEKLQMYEQIQRNGAFQFRPEMLVPNGRSEHERNEFARRLTGEFRYQVTESGINELHRASTKLMFLQLLKEGVPISWWTIAKIFKIPNFGPPPAGTNTELERWIAQQQMKIELQGDLQKEMMTIQAEMGPGQVGPGAAGGNSDVGEAPPIPMLGEQNRGRPQSYQRPPRIVQKDRGSRSTVTTA